MRRAGDPRGGGTSAWVTAVRERTFGNVTEKLLMMILCDYIDGNDECWPGNSTLAPDVGVDPRTIKRALARLEEAGVVGRRRRERTDGQGRLPDAIVFLWPGFQKLPLVGGDQGDTLSTDQGDTGDRPRGHSKRDQGDIQRRPIPLEPHHKNPHKEPPPRTAVELVFDAWKASTKKTAATVLDPKRRGLIIKALDTYPVTDVLDAVRGWEHSAHHRGDNETGTVYNDLGLLLRDAANIERFRDLARGLRQPGRKSPTSHLPPSDRVLAEDPNYWEEP